MTLLMERPTRTKTEPTNGKANSATLRAQTLRDLLRQACDGFAHQSHVTSRFKQLVGITPGRWLRAQRKAK